MTPSRRPPGFGATELIVTVVIATLAILYLLLALPRGREASRRATCQRNLMQIGTALGLYHQSAGRLPAVVLGADSPHTSMILELGRPDFLGLHDRAKAPPRVPGFRLVEGPVRGFVCPSDVEATSGRHPAPISYRANAGTGPEGADGPFAIGGSVTLAEVESADGASFTAAFAERLVGEGMASPGPSVSAYAVVPSPVVVVGCPEAPASALRGDAGASWRRSGWASTLYNHALEPNAPRSCVADDGRTALMGASSPHLDGAHVLMLDGSLRTYRPAVEPGVWKALGGFGTPPP